MVSVTLICGCAVDILSQLHKDSCVCFNDPGPSARSEPLIQPESNILQLMARVTQPEIARKTGVGSEHGRWYPYKFFAAWVHIATSHNAGKKIKSNLTPRKSCLSYFPQLEGSFDRCLY